MVALLGRNCIGHCALYVPAPLCADAQADANRLSRYPPSRRSMAQAIALACRIRPCVHQSALRTTAGSRADWSQRLGLSAITIWTWRLAAGIVLTLPMYSRCPAWG